MTLETLRARRPRRPALTTAPVAVIVLAGLLTGCSSTTDQDQDQDPDPYAGRSASSGASTSSSPAPAPPCPPEVVDRRAPPPDVRLVASDGISWPVSDTVGPTATRDGLPACFEHSPTGAALAAVVFLYSQIDRSALETLTSYAARTPGRDVALERLNGHAESESRELITAAGVEVVGYTLGDIESDRAEIAIVIADPASSTGVRGIPFDMVWAEGDWRVRIPDSGALAPAVDVGADGFTRWIATEG